jgi:hypothetical protein
MPQEANPAPYSPAVGSEVFTKHHRSARSQSNEPSTDAKERGLACTIGPTQQKYLFGANVKIDSS